MKQERKVYFIVIDGSVVPGLTYYRRDAAERCFRRYADMLRRGAIRIVHELRMVEKDAGTLNSYF